VIQQRCADIIHAYPGSPQTYIPRRNAHA